MGFYFFLFFSVSESKELPEVVRTVLKQEITRLFGDGNAKSFNLAYLSKHSSSIPHRLAGERLLFFTNPLCSLLVCRIEVSVYSER